MTLNADALLANLDIIEQVEKATVRMVVQALYDPEHSMRQALFVDSKAEKIAGSRTTTIQTSQTSMHIRQVRQQKPVNVLGEMDTIAMVRDVEYLTTTIFVKYNYAEDVAYHPPNRLVSISVLCLPNGLLQHRYNPNANDGIWLAGRNAPTRGESFRVRISLTALKNKANWRVQTIAAIPDQPFTWDD